MKGGHDHIIKRKRAKKEFNHPYPSENPKIKFLDNLVLFFGGVGPLFVLPQILKIIRLQDAGSISLLTFVAFTIIDIPWIIYGIVHKAKPIIVAYTLWFFLNLAVVILIVLY